MFDPVSLGIMGGGAMLGGGMSLLSGFIGQGAAADAQAGQLGMLDRALASSQMAAANASNLFSPYQLYGSSALSFLQSRILNSNERQMASVSQRAALQADVERLSKGVDWDSMPILTGEKASERRASMWHQMESDRKQQLAAAQSKLQAFDKEQAALAPFQAEQDAQMKATQGRINSALDLVSQSSNFNLPQSLAQLRSDMTNDPIFQFRQQTGERAINRAAAARGNYLSGAAIASIGDFNNQLTADETDRYFNRLLTGKTAQLQGAIGGLGALTGANQLDVNNLMGLSQIGLSAAQGGANAIMQGNQVNANIQSQMGQSIANTEMAKGAAIQQGIDGFAQALGTSAGLASMSGMFSPGANVGKPGAQAINPTGLTGYSAGGSNFLVNAPR